MASVLSLKSFSARPPFEQAKAVEKGLPVRVLRDLVTDPAVTIADVARVVGPRRTIDRRLKENADLSPEESDRFARFVMILDLTTNMFGSRAEAMAWLSAPKRQFEGERPLDMLKTDAGTRLIESLLNRARHGMMA
jgi:putative toxin-antitoxin system antitoxin component (TIGR02293 family)